MRIFNKSAIELCAKVNAPASDSLRARYAEAIKAVCLTPSQVKAQVPKASIIASNCVVFDIAVNGYGLIALMTHKFHSAYVKFFGTHAGYARINAANVDHAGAHHGKKDN